jgi:cation:H+ antiporter
MIISILLLIVGFVTLIKGADFFVDGASGIAGNFKVSKMLIGLTIVAFGTSAPEFAVSVKSLISGNVDLVLGNVIGSNILNIFLILGIAALFHPLSVKNNTVKKELPITMMMTVAFAVLLSDQLFDKRLMNSFTRGDGIVLVLFFSVFIYYLIAMTKNKVDVEPDVKVLPMKKSILYSIVGVLGIVLGSHFVVDSAVVIAEALGVTERMISLTIIALGTSLPELVTSVTATRKGEYDIAIGNVVGSNIFNIGMVVGIPVAIFGGIPIVVFSYLDLLMMVIASVMLFMFSFDDYKITKVEGIIFLLMFTIYYIYVVFI